MAICDVANNSILIPLGGKRGEGRFAIVDQQFPVIADFNWSLTHSYAFSWLAGLLHRFVMELAGIAKPSERHVIDHVNGDPLDNRLCNLRWASPADNAHNMRNSKKSTCHFKGVHKFGIRYRAMIAHNGKSKHIGVYATPEDAARAYDAKAIELFGEFALTNADLGLLPDHNQLHASQPEGATR